MKIFVKTFHLYPWKDYLVCPSKILRRPLKQTPETFHNPKKVKALGL